jgi:hypothetical protein
MKESACISVAEIIAAKASSAPSRRPSNMPMAMITRP